ncbi:MAG: pirin family protein [Spirochaetia bacterium]|nr:pirin family protein [Spirochaetia bacterium]
MSFHYLPYEEQAYGAFDSERILERKPIGFSQDEGGMKPFSTLFYWAFAWSDSGGLIAEHPHQGFEICSFILRGEIEHFDNKANAWKKLNTGDAQIIRAGNGITHAERMGPGSAMFQIWFDPDLSHTLRQPPTYDDYRAADFPAFDRGSMHEVTIVGDDSPFEMKTPAVVKRYSMKPGPYNIPVDPTAAVAVYVLEGAGVLGGKQTKKGDFGVLVRENTIAGTMETAGELFAIQVPGEPPYPLYSDRYG